MTLMGERLRYERVKVEIQNHSEFSNEQTPPRRGGLGSRIATRYLDAGVDAPVPECQGQNIDPMRFEFGHALRPECDQPQRLPDQ